MFFPELWKIQKKMGFVRDIPIIMLQITTRDSERD